MAIVGMGVAGVDVLTHLTEAGFDGRIDCYDERQQFGSGLPYQEDFDIFLLNPRSHAISLNPDRPKEFAEWVKEKGLTLETFMPRRIFGQYMREKLEHLLQNEHVHVHYQHIQHVQVLETGEKERYQLTYQSADQTSVQEVYDAVFLCLGHAPSQDPYHLNDSPYFIQNPYPIRESLQAVPMHQRAAVIGMGLTGVDMVRALMMEREAKEVVMFSRSGQLPIVRGTETVVEPVHLTIEAVQKAVATPGQLTLPLEQVEEWFFKDLAHYQFDLERINQWVGASVEQLRANLNDLDEAGRFQAYVAKLRWVLRALWSHLSRQDQMRFAQKYQRSFIAFSNPMAPPVAEKLLEWMETGRLITTDQVDDIIQLKAQQTGHFMIQYKNKTTTTVDWILNGIGSQTDFSQCQTDQPLVQQLLNDRVVEPNGRMGLMIHDTHSSVLSSRYGELRALKLFGQMVSGTDYQNNSTFVLYRTTQKGVHDALNYLKDKKV